MSARDALQRWSHSSLCFSQIISVLEVDESGWWKGVSRNGIEGWFPSNYIEVMHRRPFVTCTAFGSLGPGGTPPSSDSSLQSPPQSVATAAASSAPSYNPTVDAMSAHELAEFLEPRVIRLDGSHVLASIHQNSSSSG